LLTDGQLGANSLNRPTSSNRHYHHNQLVASSKGHRAGRIKRRHRLLVNSAILCEIRKEKVVLV